MLRVHFQGKNQDARKKTPIWSVDKVPTWVFDHQMGLKLPNGGVCPTCVYS